VAITVSAYYKLALREANVLAQNLFSAHPNHPF